MATLNLPVIGQDVGTWGQKINDAIAAINAEVVGVLSDEQLWTGVKNFVDKPIVPDSTFTVGKIAATGTRDATTYLRADGTWSVPPGGTSSNVGSNAIGTLNNPVTDSAAPRPTGLTRVVWDCAVDPTNWAIGDYNLQAGS